MPESAQIDENRLDVVENFVRTSASELWPGSEIAGRSAVPGDASSRAYLRFRLTGRAPCPATAVAMVMEDASIALSSDELGVFGEGGPEEPPFVNVQRYLRARTDAVPEIYSVSEDRSILLLEDVGDTALWDAASAAPDRAEELFAAALVLIAELQAAATEDSGCYAFRQRFDEKLFLWEFEHFLEYGVEDADASLLAETRAELEGAASRLAAMPTVFCHRDYHAWNIHIVRGRPRIIDFQDALIGPQLYDVASLLTDRITPRLIDPERERRLVRAFLTAREGAAPDAADLDSAMADYRLVALQRALKVVGRFHYLSEIKGKTHYVSMVPAAAATAARMLAELETFPATTKLLAESGKIVG
jgi:aminoglycoside/choline kinase family phosphotransferase